MYPKIVTFTTFISHTSPPTSFTPIPYLPSSFSPSHNTSLTPFHYLSLSFLSHPFTALVHSHPLFAFFFFTLLSHFSRPLSVSLAFSHPINSLSLFHSHTLFALFSFAFASSFSYLPLISLPPSLSLFHSHPPHSLTHSLSLFHSHSLHPTHTLTLIPSLPFSLPRLSHPSFIHKLSLSLSVSLSLSLFQLCLTSDYSFYFHPLFAFFSFDHTSSFSHLSSLSLRLSFTLIPYISLPLSL
ncbi:unnamed protein product [Acanthosepion pharaonis]|uniref:Uncharacterized protein n=1 Tax=Acanthosepion pharaonis TaxID=158019 RepID=A0A812CY40_ACAPH|nr:unnamed protein product [Sepia pharaonis]